MISKGHCFMNNTAFFDLYCEFYDFTPAIEQALSISTTTNQDKTIQIITEEDSDHHLLLSS